MVTHLDKIRSMKLRNIFNVVFLGVLLLGVSSCNMDTPMNYYVDPSKPKTLQDVQNELNGAYNQFAGSSFYGRNVVALSDIVTGFSAASPDKGHFVSINDWIFTDTDSYFETIWQSGYVVIPACTGIINDAKALLEASKSDKDKVALNNILMQAYGLKAFTYYTLVNIFSKDVVNNGGTLGLVLIKDTKVKPKEKVERSTVAETYAYILELIANGRAAATAAGEKAVLKDPLYITPIGLDAMEARIKLSMHDYAGAKDLATSALKSYKGISNEDYLAMWQSNAASAEDIFTLKKSEDDNLSANALNTLYGSYMAYLSPKTTSVMKESDIRSKLIATNVSKDLKAPHPAKWDGLPSAQAVSNIPVLRYSEMYLIIAEAEANLGNLAAATSALFNVAKRDTAIQEATFKFDTKEALLQAISDERIREFFSEGHSLFDLKRTGAAFELNGDKNFVIANYAFPIPKSEINAGFMTQQNDDWKTLIPILPKP